MPISKLTVRLLAVVGFVCLSISALVWSETPLKPYTIDSDTVGLWHFDEGAGDLARAEGSSHLDGKVIGATYTEGIMGNCLRFDGISNAVEVPDHPSLNFGAKDSFTVEAWVRTKKGKESLIVDKRPGAAFYIFRIGGFHYLAGKYGTVDFIINDGTNEVIITGNTNVADGKWHHLAGVRDKSSNTLRLYVDGKEDASPVPDPTGKIANQGSLKIGCHYYYTVPKNGVKGLIDEVRISRKARSPSELQQGAVIFLPATEPKKEIAFPLVEKKEREELKVFGFAYGEIQPLSLEPGGLVPLTTRDEGSMVVTAPKATVPEKGFRFVVLADTHIGELADWYPRKELSTKLLPKVVEEIKGLKPRPDFLVHLGDMTMNGLAYMPVGNVEELEEFKEIIEKTGLPVYPVIGNHDSRAAFRTVFLGEHPPNNAEIYYSFTFGGWHLIFLDSGDENLGCSENQRIWLRGELEKNKDKPVMLFLHHPMILIGGKIHLTYAKQHLNPDHATMLKLVSEYPNVRWIFNGHTHHNELWKYHGINFVSNPPVTTYSVFEERIGYRIVDVKGDKVRTILRHKTHLGEIDIKEMKSFKFEEIEDPAPEDFPIYIPYD